MPAGYGDFWLDPQDEKNFGPNSVYLKTDLAEAKKLLSAAGYDGRPLSIQNSDRDDANALDVVRGMVSQALNVQTKVLPYEPTWRQTCQASQGLGYDGVCYNVGTGLNAEQHISRWYTPEGRYAYSKEETPVLTDLARKIRVEINRPRQIEMIKEFQRQAAVIQPLIMNIGSSTSFGLHWPWLENFDVWTGFPSAHLKAYYWYNKARDPKAS